MGARDEVVERLEKASLAFNRAGQTEQAIDIMRVANALRQLPPEIADNLVEEIVQIVEAGLR